MMKTYRRLPALFVAFILLISATSLRAGWVITGKYIDPEGKTILQRYFIQDFNVKFEQYNLLYTVNLKTNTIILVDPENLEYYQGTLASYIQGLRQQKQRQLDILVNDIPASQQAEARSMYADQIRKIGSPLTAVSDSVTIVRSDDSLVVFEGLTEKYLVSLNKRRAEEIWISPELNINSQFNWNKYLYFLSLVEPENTTLKYMVSKPYSQLLERGFPVRRIVVANGSRQEYQFSQMVEKKIPDYEFYIPSLCKRLTIEQWLNRTEKKETKDDDYE